MDSYYKELTRIANEPVEEQIHVLQDIIESEPDFYWAYLKLTELYIYHNQQQPGFDFFNRLLQNQQGVSNCHWALGLLQNSKKEYQKALQDYERALQTPHPPFELITEYTNLQCAIRQIDKVKSFLETVEWEDTKKEFAFALLNLNMEKLQTAKEQFSRLVEKDTSEELLYQYGVCLYRLHNFEHAESVFEKALKLAEKRNHLKYRARFYKALGTTLNQLGQTELAEQYLKQALKIAKSINDFYHITYANASLAYLYREEGQMQAAIPLLSEAAQGFERLHRDDNAVRYNRNLAKAYYLNFQYAEAIQIYEKVILMLEQSGGMLRQRIKILIDLGHVYRHIGAYHVSHKYYSQALASAQQYNITEFILKSQCNLIKLYIKQRKHDKAIALWQKIKDNDYIQKHQVYFEGTYYLLGISYELEKEYDKAREYYRKVVDFMKESQLDSYYYFRFLYLAHLDMVEEKYELADTRMQKVLNWARSQNDEWLLAEASMFYAQLMERRGNFYKAVTYYDQAIQLFEKTRKGLLSNDSRAGFGLNSHDAILSISECYYKLYQQDPNPRYLENIFYYEEMRRARALKDYLANQEIYHALQDTLKHDNEFQAVCRTFSEQQMRIRQKVNVEHVDVHTLEKEFSDLTAFKYSLIAEKANTIDVLDVPMNTLKMDSLALMRVQEELQNSESAAIFYHLNDSACFALVLTGDRIEVVPLPADFKTITRNIETLLLPFHQQDKTVKDITFHAGIAHELYRVLFHPVAAAVALPSRLLILRDAHLYNVPFEMLLTKAPPRKNYTPVDEPDYSEHFLLHHRTFYYSPTTYVLLDQQKISRKNMLVLANPVSSERYTRESMRALRSVTGWIFNALPFAELESQKIKELIGQADIYKRTEASESMLKKCASDYDILHIASHAFADTVFEAFSGLVLAAETEDTDDGILMGYEVETLDIQCDLVTLSACETGLGRLMAGEGVMGLPRQFLCAGAQSVLMSAWKVDDQFTAEFMPAFYRYYLKENISKPGALVRAKRDICNPLSETGGMYYQHPFFWAAFTLYGRAGHPTSTFPWMLFSGILVFCFGVVGVGILVKKARR